jgi:hypothetical protein
LVNPQTTTNSEEERALIWEDIISRMSHKYRLERQIAKKRDYFNYLSNSNTVKQTDRVSLIENAPLHMYKEAKEIPY